jgi:hypothetical protein
MNLNRRGRMVVEFTTTCAIIAYHHLSCEFEPLQGYGGNGFNGISMLLLK